MEAINSKQSTDIETNQVNEQVEDIWSDFTVPDELRKNLEYPANQRKRQLSLEHIERKTADKLAEVNARLKADKVRVSVTRTKDALQLQATLPLRPSDSSKDGSPNKQYKLSLGIPFSLDGVRVAEKEARELGLLLLTKQFQWNEKYLGKGKVEETEKPKTIGELMEVFEKEYFMTRKRNRQSEGTFKAWLWHLNKLPKESILSNSIIKTCIVNTETGTANRISTVRALSVFCNTFKFEFDFKGYRDGYVPKARNLPTDNEIIEAFKLFDNKTYRSHFQQKARQWIYGILATYGLRGHEIWAIDLEKYCHPDNVRHVITLNEKLTDGVKTGERIIYPLRHEWVELFDLKNFKLLKSNQSLRRKTNLIADGFRLVKINFQPYDLRHAYAIRGHELGIPIDDMARWMGHSVVMHTEAYQKYMTQATHDKIFDNMLAQQSGIRVELSEVERLRVENEALKAELEQANSKIEQLTRELSAK